MKKLAVFCGSSKGVSDVYIEGAKLLGRELAVRQIALVYGGSSLGVMGALADEVLEAGGHVIGVMPTFLDRKEISHKRISEQIIVGTMHERKAKMAELADGFIALPGGPGTLEEFFEVFTWGQIGLHQKPIGVLNINLYYDPLIALINHMTDEEFLAEQYRSMAIIEQDAGKLLDKFQTYQAPPAKTFPAKKEPK